MRKLTLEDFIAKSIEKHGLDRYNYSKVNFQGTSKKVTIICNKCSHVFEQLANNHLRGQGCPECCKLSTKKIIKRFKEKHGNNFDYSKVNYVSLHNNVIIRCVKHDYSFNQRPDHHLEGNGGCPLCLREDQAHNLEQFINDSKKIHGDFYDYSKSNYINNRTNIEIICPIHGSFFQIPSNHKKGCGCPNCKADNLKFSTEEFCKKAIEIFGNFYNYSKVNYINNDTYVTIICPKHGPFRQLPRSHLSGHGCWKCKVDAVRLPFEKWLEIVKSNHIVQYDYSLVNFKSLSEQIEIICPIHGIFKQSAWNHLQGKSCSKCNCGKSKGEKELCEFIKSIYSGEILENSRKLLGNRMELDIYLPELKLAFEYNGEYWHLLKEKRFPGCHKKKRDRCMERKIELVEISDTQWRKNIDNMKRLISEVINNKLKTSI